MGAKTRAWVWCLLIIIIIIMNNFSITLFPVKNELNALIEAKTSHFTARNIISPSISLLVYAPQKKTNNKKQNNTQ